jgi:hypothetical protein
MVSRQMHRLHRVIGIAPMLVLALAACADPDAGGQGSADATAAGSAPAASAAGSASADSSTAASAGASGAGASATASGSATAGGEAQRVDISVLTGDPGAYADQEIRVLARVDEVVVEEESFYTSASASEADRLLVVVASDAQVDKELAAGGVVWATGTVVEASAEAMEGAGASSGELPEGYEGEYALVATAIEDPLAGE